MSEPFLGEIRMFGGNFAPVGWALCDGRLLAIAQFEALYSLLGTTYGGDGMTSFALPDLRSRVPVHQGRGAQGNNYIQGQIGGAESVTLKVGEMPAHTHIATGDNEPGDVSNPSGAVWAADDALQQFAAGTAPTTPMSARAISPAGGSQPHENRSPALALNFIIALEGIYPSRS